MTIKKKFLISIIIMTIISVATILFSNIFLFSKYVDTNMNDRIDSASEIMTHEIESLKSQSYNASMQIAKDAQIISALSNGNTDELLSRSIELRNESGVEFCTISNFYGIALARPHKPDSYGDDITAMPSVKSALTGKSMTVIEEGTSVRLSICSGTPVYDGEGMLIGVVVVGYRLDTDYFVDSVKKLTGCEATVFLQDERISTTIIKNDETRAIGTKAAENISQQVLAGKAYSGKAKILEREAVAKYNPLVGNNGKTIGMLFVGRYIDEKTNTVWSFVRMGIIIMMVILAASVLIALLISVNIEKQLKNIITKLTASSSKMYSATNELTNASANLADGSSKQAAAIEEISATMNESAAMIAQTADNIEKAFELAKNANDNSLYGIEKMQNVIQSMDALKESADDIGNIIKSIDDIAYNTNLLSLNAMVEAARAGGEAGQSFSIVAEEVRKLSKKSAEEAAHTADIISKNIALTNASRKIIYEASSKINDVAGSIGNLNVIIEQISTASNEQAAGIKQINAAVSQMEKVTQENAASAEETSASAQQLKEEAANLEEMVEPSLKLIKSSRN